MQYCKNNANLRGRRELRRNQSDAERLFWHHVRNRQFFGYKFYRQYSASNYILDFYCPEMRLAVELDGGQHAGDSVRDYDLQRTQYLNSQGIRVVRFWNNEVLQNIEGVLGMLYREYVEGEEKKITPPTLPLDKGRN